MPLFTVTNIIDGNTIQVAGWEWNSYAGTNVKVAGYNVNGQQYNDFAKSKLKTLILDKQVELKRPTKADKGTTENSDVLYCSVFLNDVDIALYFPELQKA